MRKVLARVILAVDVGDNLVELDSFPLYRLLLSQEELIFILSFAEEAFTIGRFDFELVDAVVAQQVPPLLFVLRLRVFDLFALFMQLSPQFFFYLAHCFV